MLGFLDDVGVDDQTLSAKSVEGAIPGQVVRAPEGTGPEIDHHGTVNIADAKIYRIAIVPTMKREKWRRFIEINATETERYNR